MSLPAYFCPKSDYSMIMSFQQSLFKKQNSFFRRERDQNKQRLLNHHTARFDLRLISRKKIIIGFFFKCANLKSGKKMCEEKNIIL
jgi:hypothetical protein